MHAPPQAFRVHLVDAKTLNLDPYHKPCVHAPLQASSTSGEGLNNASSWSDYVRDNPLARRIKEWQTGLTSKLAFGGGGGARGGAQMATSPAAEAAGQSRAAGRRHKPADSVESLEGLRHSVSIARMTGFSGCKP